MTISYNWLKDYIDIPESPEEAGRMLTSTGLEVEAIRQFDTIRGGLRGVVIGQVLTSMKHPNADKLSLTTVDVGGDRPLQIVCGAPNVAAGQKVVVALPGTTLYNRAGAEISIKSAKIRGELSEGMICAEDELGIGDSHDGIMVLQTNVASGTPAAAFFGIESDHVIEIGLTPNRADAASHIGVARDLRALTGRAIRWPSVDHFKADNESLHIPVTIENAEACPRYSAITISGVRVGPSPPWLVNKLLAIGLTPINNIVDITNFVCHEIGQPLHAFDADRIKGGKVVVRTMPAGTRFITLDNKERLLNANDLMICDAVDPMCIAGVFGGVNSGITDETRNVFLESACFAPSYIRRTSMQHQLKTDASFRFERGTDPEITVYALKRAALLIREVAGGQISSRVIDCYPQPVPRKQVSVRDRNVNRLIGKVITRKEIFDILQSLDITVISESDIGYEVSIPQYRVDVTQEADVIEEILRIYGFNNIELTSAARTDFLAEFPVKNPDKYKRSVGELLVSNGFYEIWTNSLTKQSYLQRYNLQFPGEPVEILNKLSEDLGILRQTMLFTGLEVCAYNINRKQKDLKLFEFGRIYYEKDGRYSEEERLAIYMTGNVETENWQRRTQPVSYYDIAQHVSHILSRSGVTAARLEPHADEMFDYGSRIMAGHHEAGRIGKVKTLIVKDFGIRQDLFYADLSTSLLFNAATPKLVIQDVPKFPEVKRDLSLVLDKPVQFDQIRKVVLETERTLVREIVAFDVYEGENIPKGKKAYALSFTLLDETKTLTDEEIDRAMERLMRAFEKNLGAIIRK